MAATTPLELRMRRKSIGDAWEDFCVDYLIVCENYQSAQRLTDVGDNELVTYGLGRKDMGIDLIAKDAEGHPVAVQCKFRTKGNVSWREISTFYALCARTGPWKTVSVMTNRNRVSREGNPLSHERAILCREFEAIPRHLWLVLAKYTDTGSGQTIGGTAPDRMAWLDRVSGRTSTAVSEF